jgi:uncharacterized protein (TIRG00374 family)
MRRWYVWGPISLGLFALLLWRTRPWEAAALASRLDLTPLAIALAANVAVILVLAVRASDLMAAVGSPLGVRRLVPVVSFANTISNLTPASSGEVVRALILHRRHAVPYSNATAAILAERLWAFGIMLVTSAAAAVGTLIPASPWVVALAWAAALVASFAPLILYRLGIRPGPLAERFAAAGGAEPGRMRRLAGHVADVDARLSVILTHPVRAIWFVITSGTLFFILAAQLWLVLFALGDTVPIVAAWAAYGLAICAGVVSALPFGLGAADVVLVVLLGTLGVDPATAGATTLLLRLVTTLPLGIAGTISWIHLNRPAREAEARIEGLASGGEDGAG